ncbi:hypothetical protein SDC9_188159 [bioreactor metagenome]|uniref:Uncharacterized protein n=1 Tax=bioreactor metagenome TaxID=1076179 RepID=A0A645HNJ5_9ZZZZ
MNDAVMIWAYDELITGVVIKTVDKVVNMMCFNHLGSILIPDKLSANLTSETIEEF